MWQSCCGKRAGSHFKAVARVVCAIATRTVGVAVARVARVSRAGLPRHRHLQKSSFLPGKLGHSGSDHSGAFCGSDWILSVRLCYKL